RNAAFASLTAADVLIAVPISGAIRHTANLCSTIESCTLTGYQGVTFSSDGVVDLNGSFSATGSVENCKIIPSPNGGIIGTVGLNAVPLAKSLDMVGWWNAIRMSGNGTVVLGGRFEVNGIAIVSGQILPSAGGGTSCQGFLIAGMSFEANYIAAIATDIAAMQDGWMGSFFALQNRNINTYGLFLGSGTGNTVSNCSFT